MRRVVFALVVALVAGAVCAQESAEYAPADNPFQGDFTFVLGQPVALHVVVLGVRLADLTLTPTAGVRPGEKVKCKTVVAGNNTTDKAANVTTVLLLEDADGKALSRIVLDPIRAKAGKEFKSNQAGAVAGETLAAARKVYLLFMIEF